MIKTIFWENDAVVMIDQRALPVGAKDELPLLVCRDYREVVSAIKNLAVRGAPAIGVAAALGIALGIRQHSFANKTAGNKTAINTTFNKICAEFAASRPTAINLFWAIDKMKQRFAVLLASNASTREIAEGLLQTALSILTNDIKTNQAIGASGQTLIADGDSILTHCNAGALACAGYGTALGVLRAAQEAGKKFSVYVDETRPVLQGARLTAWELQQEGIEMTLICDNMAGALMAAGRVTQIITGADRIATNGDAANKIGTYSLAVLARAHGIPFYIAAPLSTFDLSLADGEAIPIEERDASEITHIGETRIAPEGIKVFNPAFDVTPAKLITAIITEFGIIRTPYRENIARISAKAKGV